MCCGNRYNEQPTEYCEECQERLVLDDDGEVAGGCPIGNPLCQHAVYTPDDQYIPLNFHDKGED